eukprot:6204952-Pleurochrysis_carterae.AAC.5
MDGYAISGAHAMCALLTLLRADSCSAVLQPPSVEDNRAKLVNGSVERYVRANTTANQGAVEDGYVPFGTFGGYMLVEGAE